MVAHLLKKLPACDETRRCVTSYPTICLYCEPSESRLFTFNPIYSISSSVSVYLPIVKQTPSSVRFDSTNIWFDFSLSSTPITSSGLVLSGFQIKTLCTFSDLSHASCVSFSSFTIWLLDPNFVEKYELWDKNAKWLATVKYHHVLCCNARFRCLIPTYSLSLFLPVTFEGNSAI